MPLPLLSLAEIRGFVIPPAGWNLADNRYQDLGIESPACLQQSQREGDKAKIKPTQLEEALPPSTSLPSEPLDFGLETEWRGPQP